ncbi:MAG: TIGR01777 family oxidoreductase [Chloroflexota bacterium]
MKIAIAGGSGHLGQVLAHDLTEHGHEIVVLSRSGGRIPGGIWWDGRHLGPWTDAIDGADAVINLAGRSVNCRYNKTNLQEMMGSRVDSTRVMGQAIAAAVRPPRVWLQMSTATIYAHRFDAPNDEATGLIGGDEPDAPTYWRTSIDIAEAWERTLAEAETPHTRKVAMRCAMVMSPHRGGVFDILQHLTRFGLGGPIAGGRQFMSWIHHRDFARSVRFLLEREELSGAVNLAAPGPLPQRELMATLRDACGVRIGVPAATWQLEIAAFVHRTDTELLLKSRRVVPGRLLEAGFLFEYPDWASAAHDLVARSREGVAA